METWALRMCLLGIFSCLIILSCAEATLPHVEGNSARQSRVVIRCSAQESLRRVTVISNGDRQRGRFQKTRLKHAAERREVLQIRGVS